MEEVRERVDKKYLQLVGKPFANNPKGIRQIFSMCTDLGQIQESCTGPRIKGNTIRLGIIVKRRNIQTTGIAPRTTMHHGGTSESRREKVLQKDQTSQGRFSTTPLLENVSILI